MGNIHASNADFISKDLLLFPYKIWIWYDRGIKYLCMCVYNFPMTQSFVLQIPSFYPILYSDIIVNQMNPMICAFN